MIDTQHPGFVIRAFAREVVAGCEPVDVAARLHAWAEQGATALELCEGFALVADVEAGDPWLLHALAELAEATFTARLERVGAETRSCGSADTLEAPSAAEQSGSSVGTPVAEEG